MEEVKKARKAPKKYLQGERYGMLVIQGEAEPTPKGFRRVRCLCDCGKETLVCTSNFPTHTTSCGCQKRKVFDNYREKVRSGEIIPEKLIGERFGSVVVNHFVHWDVRNEKDPRISVWDCTCDCGVNFETRITNLSDVSSCGCERRRKIAEARTIHGMHGTRTHKSWMKMKERCRQDCYVEKEYYQDRGIDVCDEWYDSFEKFYEDMGERPEGMTLDRIDTNEGYYKDNCRWADLTVQAYNRRMSSANTSGRTGVSLNQNGTYNATIGYYRKVIVLATNVSFEEACKAREAGEIKYYGQIKE